MMTILPFIAVIFLSVNSTHADFLDDASIPFARVDTTFKAEKYPILSPLKGGHVKVLFIGQRDSVGRLSVEVAARLDCNYETILTDTRNSFGIKDPRENLDFDVLSDENIVKRADRFLRYYWDVIWLDFNFESLPERLKVALVDQISFGTGLVYVGGKSELESFITKEKVDEKPLEVVSYDTCKKPIAGRRDKGIIVVMPPVNQIANVLKTGDYYNSAANSILFSTARKTGAMITKIQLPSKTIQHDGMAVMNYRVHIFHDGKPDSMKVYVRYRNEKDELVSESANTYIIHEGNSFVIIKYPLLPIGNYSLDVSVLDSRGATAFAGTSFNVESSDSITDMKLWDLSVPVGGFVIGTVETSFEFEEGTRFTAELFDCLGRSLDKYDLDTIMGRKSLDFTFKVKYPLSRTLLVRVSYYKNNELIQTIEKPVFVRGFDDSDKFLFVVCDDYESEILSLKKYKILVDEGVNVLARDFSSINDPGKAFNTAVNVLLSGTAIIPEFTGTTDYLGDKMKEPVINYKTILKQRLETLVDTLRHVNPMAYSVSYGNMLAPNKTDMDYSKIDIESFHVFLKKKYGSIENLNKAWNTHFVSFSEAKPITLDEAKQTESFTIWLDTGLHMFDVFTQIGNFTRNEIAKYDSTAKVGIREFPSTWNVFNGYNLFDYSDMLGMIVLAQDAGFGLPGDRAASGALASFAQSSALKGLMVSDMWYSQGNEALLHSAPWQSLFSGMNSIWWEKVFGGVNAALTPEFSISPAFSIVAEETRDIMDGIDRLLLGSSRHVDGIGILYSLNSIIAAYTSVDSESQAVSSSHDYFKIFDSATPSDLSNIALNSARSFYLACLDGGYTPGFITEDQVKADLLIDGGFSVLFLPYSQALSEETIRHIKEFTKQGGTVIADVRPAVMEENLSMSDNGALDEIFGISQGTDRIAPEISGAFITRDAGMESDIPSGLTIHDCRGDPSIKLIDGAVAMANVGESPALVTNTFGKGKGIFLNVGMEIYEKLRSMNDERSLLDVISWCIETSDIGLPVVTINNTNGNRSVKVNTAVFKDNTGQYVGFLRVPGSINNPDVGENEFIININHIETRPYIYNVRKRKYLGAVKNVPLELLPGRSALYALLPYRVRDLALEIKSVVVHIGDKLDYSVTVIPQDSDTKPGRHVIHVQIINPEGIELPYFSDSFEAVNGYFEASIPISLSDPPGRWILRVSDVATGKMTERVFMIMDF